MKLCRFTAGNGDVFPHTPNTLRKLALSPPPLDIRSPYQKNVRLERLAVSWRKITIHAQVAVAQKNWCLSSALTLTMSETHVRAIHCDKNHNSETVSTPMQKMGHCQPVVNSVLRGKWRSDLQIPYVGMNFIHLSCAHDIVVLNWSLGFRLSIYYQHWKLSCPTGHV